MFLEVSWIYYIEIIKIPTETNNWKPTGTVRKYSFYCHNDGASL